MRILSNHHAHLDIEKLLKRWDIDEKPTSYKNFNSGLEIIQSIGKKISADKQKAVLAALESMNFNEQRVNFIKGLDSLNEFADTLENTEERALIIQDIQVWKRDWHIFLRSEPGSNINLTSFLNYISLGNTKAVNHEGIALLTVHSAKGLEFDVVIIMGMVEGTFPDYRAKNSAALEDEKRNMFVAVTRSKRILGLSYPKTKVMPWGDECEQQPSRYLNILKSSEKMLGHRISSRGGLIL
jgi:DNA helicase-2/ATP-dependent DNA helicase PcrA